MNVLVTSISRKVPLLQAVRKACEKLKKPYTLFGADGNPNVIGRFFVDQFWEMPSLEKLSISELIKFCKEKQIQAIIPTRDGELSYFAKFKGDLLNNGIYVMVSEYDAVWICFDKLRFYEECSKNNLPAIQTFDSFTLQSDISRWVVKERYGAGSKNLFVNVSKEQVRELASQMEHPIFQPYINGEEYSADLYINREGKVKGCICRRRELVLHGESQITTTVRNEELERVCKIFAEAFQLYGHIVLQILVDDANNFHIIECNCRFGGASTLSIAAGLDSFYWFLLEVMGENLDNYLFQRSNIEKKLVRYPKDLIIEESDIY